MKPAQLKAFKKTKEKELQDLANILESIFPDIETSPIYEACSQVVNLIPTLKNGHSEPTYWGYSIENLVLPLSTVKHIRPIGIGETLELCLGIKMIADAKEWDKLTDPFLELNFKMEIVGLSGDKIHTFGWHIDKHIVDEHNNEPHPLYHIQYTNDFLPKKEEFDWGETLYLDTPRLLHHPVDLILGIGLATINFHPESFDKLINDAYFMSIYEKYQNAILAPYYHNLSSYWQVIPNLNWNLPKDLCPHLL